RVVVAHTDAGAAPPSPMEPTTAPGAPAPGVTGPVVTVPSATGPGEGPTERVPLGLVCGARSGDKGGNANVGLWARSPAQYEWLRSYLTIERVRQPLTE